MEGIGHVGVVALMAVVQNTVVQVAAALIEQDVVDQTLVAPLYHGLHLNKHSAERGGNKLNQPTAWHKHETGITDDQFFKEMVFSLT